MNTKLERSWTRILHLLTVVGLSDGLNGVRLELKGILLEYLPKIRKQIVNLERAFNELEEENHGHRVVGSQDALEREGVARKEARRLSKEMLDKISNVPLYRYFYHLPKKPTKLIVNPYPGYYLSSEPAIHYCDFLLDTYGK